MKKKIKDLTYEELISYKPNNEELLYCIVLLKWLISIKKSMNIPYYKAWEQVKKECSKIVEKELED